MAQPETASAHFMTPRFFGSARVVGGVAIHAEPDQLRGMGGFLQEEYGFGLPADPTQIDFVYFWTGRGAGGNTHYHQAGPETRFLPEAALRDTRALSVPKRAIEMGGRTVVELQTKDLVRPQALSVAAARALLAQTPEQAGFAGGSEGWDDFLKRKGTWGGVGDAIINGFLPQRFTREHRLAEKAASLFPGAVTLERAER